MTKYGRSPWIDRFPKSRVPALPRQRGPEKSDVVIIGGGLTGCATAYAFAVAGVKVMLVEAGQVGRGSSGSSGGTRLRRSAPPARREVLPRGAARRDGGHHARSGGAPHARAPGAAQGRP